MEDTNRSSCCNTGSLEGCNRRSRKFRDWRVSMPDPHCKLSSTGGHFYAILSGEIWRCKYCWTVKWYPLTGNVQDEITHCIRRYGDEGYGKYLEDYPRVSRLLVLLNEIKVVRDLAHGSIPDSLFEEYTKTLLSGEDSTVEKFQKIKKLVAEIRYRLNTNQIQLELDLSILEC